MNNNNTVSLLVELDQAINPETYLSSIKGNKAEMKEVALDRAEKLGIKDKFLKLKGDDLIDIAFEKASELGLRPEFMNARLEAQEKK